MGKLEQSLKKELRVTKIRGALLSTLKVSGLLAVSLLAPNAAGLLGKKLTRSTRNSTMNSISRLVDAGLIHIDDGLARITPRGEHFLDMSLIEGKAVPKKWDRKWRVVIFDIPEKRRRTRDRIRLALLSIGFLKLQDSVWIYPHDNEDLITLIKTEMRVGKDLLYMIVDRIENDTHIRAHFNLL